MSQDYTYIIDLSKEFQEIPGDSVISLTLYNDDQLKAVLFGFDKGQELSEHTSLKEKQN
jgi:quercetin dioxygenase-like cupin family protein